ncbi:MAG: hypothetical protein ACYCS7_03705 [Acidimicrobiales bacterium]
MSRYRFRLESVLRIRRAQEGSARHILLKDNQALAAARIECERHRAAYQGLAESRGPVSRTSFIREMALAELGAAALAEARTAVASAHQQVERSHREWSYAAMRVEALVRLERRRAQEHLEISARHEAGTIDDLVTARWIAPESLIEHVGTSLLGSSRS